MLKNQSGHLVVFAAMALIVLSVFGFVLYTSSNKSQTAEQDSSQSTGTQVNSQAISPEKVTYPPDTHPGKLTLSPADGQRFQDMTEVGFANAAFRTSSKRYYSNAAELVNLMKDKDKYRDPSTGQPYAFTDNTPFRGEMQYKLGYKCKDNLRGLGDATSVNIFALVVLMDDGSYMCKSNIQ